MKRTDLASSMDINYMERVFNLAARGWGTTHPNPMVGAVLVKKEGVIAEGFHRKPGTPHAEALVLKKAGTRARGSDLYINLEPCCHNDKRTPPCAQKIIRAGVKRVIVASRDPNPKVNGKGLGLLRREGVKVSLGLFSKEEEKLNEAYRKWVKTGFPFVILKAGMTLDGKITPPGKSGGRVTGARARHSGHELRNFVDAILVGVNTIITDDPLLTNRIRKTHRKNPLRVILDSRLRIPMGSRVLKRADGKSPLILTTRKASPRKMQALRDQGIHLSVIQEKNGRVSISAALRLLGEKGIVSLLIEGGGEVNRSAIEAGLVDKVVWFIAPYLSEDPTGVDVLGRKGKGRYLEKKYRMHRFSLTPVGRDFRFEAYLQ